MKIGIITFHSAINYGAVLQAYALQEYLKNKGHDVFIINYHCPFITNIYRVFSFRRCRSKKPFTLLKKTIKELSSIKSNIIIKRKFESFCTEKLHLTNRFTDVNKVPLDMDLYIFGSDQIWNGLLTGGLDDVYLGNFTPTNGIKISYAASRPLGRISKKERIYFMTCLASFTGISVRESELMPYISECTNSPIDIAVDPTLLVDNNIWYKLTNEDVKKDKYLFLYEVGTDSRLIKFAKDVAKSLNLKILNCQKENLSPIEFIQYIRYADFVMSNSFHATVFSIIFKKQFYVLASNNGRDARFLDLLNKLNIKDRVIYKNIPTYEYIDYKALNIDNQLKEYKSDSAKFLEHYL